MRGITEERLICWFDLFVAKKRLNELEVIRTLMDECQEINQWQTIESAPKDREVLLFYPCLGGKIVNGNWLCLNEDLGYFYSAYFSYTAEYKPTHWMDLPEPPK